MTVQQLIQQLRGLDAAAMEVYVSTSADGEPEALTTVTCACLVETEGGEVSVAEEDDPNGREVVLLS